MVWQLNGIPVLVISEEDGVLPSVNPNVTAEKNSKGNSWVFVLKHTERHNLGLVTCDLQSIDRKTSSLFVQEKGSVKVVGSDMLAFKGRLVLFECHAAGWYPEPIIQWQVNDRKISQAEYNISIEDSSKSLFTVSSNLSITAAQSSSVDCLASVSALLTPQKSSVRLTVVAEVVQEGDDCTVPLAVITSLFLLMLLLLLCIAVHWYRQRRQAKPSPQDEIRDIQMGISGFGQSGNERSSAPGETGGTVNLGFFNEGPPDEVYSEPKTDIISISKVPDVVTFSTLSLHSESLDKVCLSENSYKNIRTVTTV
ncbi:immunoglobulin superfamily member 5 isoform X3 [Notolabrus celidotus]|nr:immunoglobulin superfamily member 5 isoform X3 [Notolabrus celidotus]XP_034557288.1 immunoglobulin superfamily member 5 isoform X3 [Notolabrus celidotus]XP_034557289.1 immunoglobulin superfamily member 5 isoform X3 [Notolabrus celidotus]